MVDRPDEGANATEIAEWMSEDFGKAIADGFRGAVEEDNDGN